MKVSSTISGLFRALAQAVQAAYRFADHSRRCLAAGPVHYIGDAVTQRELYGVVTPAPASSTV
jgi:hypothetical protein